MTLCTDAEETAVWISITLTAPLSTSSLYIIFKFIQHRIQSAKKRSPACLFYLGLLFLIVSSITLFLWTFLFIFICYPLEGDFIISLMATLCYAIFQFYLLWLVMYIRLYSVFKESVHRISKCTNTCMVVLFILLPILMYALIVIFFHFDQTGTGKSIWFAFLIFAAVSLLFSLLFIGKLYKIQRHSNVASKESPVMIAMTKTIILALFSFSVSVFVAIISYFLYDYKTKYLSMWILNALLIILDIYSNFICVALSYSIFNEQYTKCCGRIDEKCRKCFWNMANSDSVTGTYRPPRPRFEICPSNSSKTVIN